MARRTCNWARKTCIRGRRFGSLGKAMRGSTPLDVAVDALPTRDKGSESPRCGSYRRKEQRLPKRLSSQKGGRSSSFFSSPFYFLLLSLLLCILHPSRRRPLKQTSSGDTQQPMATLWGYERCASFVHCAKRTSVDLWRTGHSN